MKKILTILVAVILFSGITYISTSAKGYKLIIEGVSIEPASIQPGEQFELTLKLKNNSDRDLENISILLNNIEGKETLTGFSPVGTSNELYVGTIKKGETIDKSISLISDPNLSVGTYNLVLNSFYKEKNRSTLHQESSTIGLLLQNKSRFIITNIETPKTDEEFNEEISDQIEVGFVNAGRDTIYNLKFKLTTENGTLEQFYGELGPEEEDTIEFENEQTLNENTEETEETIDTKEIHGKLEITFTNWLNKEEKILKEF
ncbi:COG1361 family protein [Clostridium sp. DL1XJH146]